MLAWFEVPLWVTATQLISVVRVAAMSSSSHGWQKPAFGGRQPATLRPPLSQINANRKAGIDDVGTWQWTGNCFGARVNVEEGAWSLDQMMERVKVHAKVLKTYMIKKT